MFQLRTLMNTIDQTKTSYPKAIGAVAQYPPPQYTTSCPPTKLDKQIHYLIVMISFRIESPVMTGIEGFMAPVICLLADQHLHFQKAVITDFILACEISCVQRLRKRNASFINHVE